MHDACDGYAFIKELEAGNHKENQTFSDFSDFLEDRAREMGVPLDGQYELTPLCNFKCKMCYVTMTQAQLSQSLLSASQWKNLISDACKKSLPMELCWIRTGFRILYGALSPEFILRSMETVKKLMSE